MQNKIHYAVHGQTAAEVIFTRADAEKEFMGLSFNYNGSIAKPALLPELIEEIKDIAQVYKWKYNI